MTLCLILSGGLCGTFALGSISILSSSGVTASLAGATVVVGTLAGGVQGNKIASNATRDVLNHTTNAEFKAKFEALVASTSAEKRKKLKWNQVEALKDIVMTAPSSREGADVCARPEQLTRAAVSNYIGAANMPTTP